ncbi:aldo/keto reductase [Fimbriimonas ginsengisoli]|uniref:Aldo-keto reductase n=1 Tax=Fimbriimonas ginsengisoli Gsoil 348 TaxID=661478 RepID=A0A068NS23_FIMGI|nr:aldo/keto reductase [Fimbriimonas ginsengisoli]AIE86246.1 Aldo-keto reductase [Fimbriimonas ginsengisoli Gsoil 348]
MKTRKIGDQTVGAIGLGCMGMSFAYGPGNDDESTRVLHRALELGVNHWDTADMYGMGANERLLSGTLKTRRDEVFLGTKFGNVFDRTLSSHREKAADSSLTYFVDGTPAYARKSLENSLQRLGVDHVDLYYLHRIDPEVPIEETIGAMAEFVREGKVRFLGISEASAETVRRAHATHPIAAVQNELSLWTQDFLPDVVPTTKELGVAFVAYSPLGRGFLTGQIKSIEDLPADDWRRNNPRFQGENFRRNLVIVDHVKAIAARHGVTPGQVALAWTLAQGEHVAPIPGTKKLKYLEENTAAQDLVLTPDDLARLSGLEPTAGTRYPEAMMSAVAR